MRSVVVERSAWTKGPNNAYAWRSMVWQYNEACLLQDIMKLNQQLGYSYSANRRASDPLQFYVTSLGGKTKERMDRVGDYPSWDVSSRFVKKC